MIPLVDIHSVNKAPSAATPKGFGFQISSSTKLTTLVVKTEEEQSKWIEAIKAAKGKISSTNIIVSIFGGISKMPNNSS